MFKHVCLLQRLVAWSHCKVHQRFVRGSDAFPRALCAVSVEMVQQFLLLLKVSRLECWASLCHADFWICLTNQSERAQVLLINITNSDKTLVFDQSERAQGPIYLTIIPWAHVGCESAITSLISNKREWNNCFIKNASKI